MRRVFICSPYRGDIERNVQTARDLCYAATRTGAAPFAPHSLYPQFLDDAMQDDRAAGINAGLAFMRVCDELWCPKGVEPTEGMKHEIAYAKMLTLPIVEVAL